MGTGSSYEQWQAAVEAIKANRDEMDMSEAMRILYIEHGYDVPQHGVGPVPPELEDNFPSVDWFDIDQQPGAE